MAKRCENATSHDVDRYRPASPCLTSLTPTTHYAMGRITIAMWLLSTMQHALSCYAVVCVTSCLSTMQPALSCYAAGSARFPCRPDSSGNPPPGSCGVELGSGQGVCQCSGRGHSCAAVGWAAGGSHGIGDSGCHRDGWGPLLGVVLVVDCLQPSAMDQEVLQGVGAKVEVQQNEDGHGE
jgi:hypothetical protein